jgi:murein DD-endopeptidase MepM/ murein hydrolase activator NlpD
MNLNRIAERISELLRLKGFNEKHTVDELADHYLTHIEEEIKRGVNSQQAIRETFQEIANIDMLEFRSNKKKLTKKWILLLSIVLLGMVYHFYTTNKNAPIDVSADNIELPNTSNTKTQEITPPSGLPIEQAKFNITSDFGFRIHPIHQEKELHRGIDIKAKLGTPVHATGDGTVLEAGFKDKAGKYIVIQHEGNYTTKYFHLSDFSVVVGTKVTKGQKIGKVGNTGMSFKPHLHYEILKNDLPVNPKIFIKA